MSGINAPFQFINPFLNPLNGSTSHVVNRMLDGLRNMTPEMLSSTTRSRLR
jgi:hypothetical protein